jgi:hypothetical protein
MISVTAAAIRLAGCLALGSALLLAPGAGHAAECSRWDVSGPWTAVQDNGTHADFTVTQGDTLIQGNAKFTQGWTRDGTFDGTLIGSDLKFNVYWSSLSDSNGHYSANEIGEYVGTISPTGRVTGTTRDKNHPQTQATWYSSRQMACAHWGSGTAAPPAPSSTSGVAKPAVALGRVQAPPGSAASPPMSICERARAAIARNSPSAQALVSRCQAEGS